MNAKLQCFSTKNGILSRIILKNNLRKLITVFLLFTVQSALAKTAATVIFTAQKVTAQSGGASRSLSRGGSVSEGDSIVTAAGASARIKYLNGTLVTIGSDSNYKIVAFAPTNSDAVIKAELIKGKIQSETSGDKKREALKTPMVALAITGTKFNVFVSSQTKTNVKVINGVVEANGRPWGAGESFVATPAGVVAAPFPAAGNITVTPAMEAATVAAGGTSSSTSGSGTSSSTSSASASAGLAGATSVSLLATVIDAGSTVSGSAAVNTGITGEIATFSIVCLPST